MVNTLFYLFLCLLCCDTHTASGYPARSFRSEQDHLGERNGSGPAAGWIDPRPNGGRFLDYTTPKYGEPLNVIISALSDPFILTEPGLHTYAKSVGFSEECLGLHYGAIHDANLGDGDGRKPEHYLARQFFFPIWGTCWESIAGGNHFRAWKQNGTEANSGAWFLAVSKEKDSTRHHGIVPNGYNIGRDWLVHRATSGGEWRGMWWKADVEWRKGLLNPGNEGINHGISQDGYVAILTAYRTPPPRPFFLRYFSIPFYRVYSSSITALLVDLIHVFFLAFAPT